MDTDSILALREALKTEGAPRHSKYEFLMSALGGDYESRRLDGLWQTFQSLIGKEVPMDREMFEFRLNLLPSILRASKSFIATVPTVRCPPTKPDDDASRALAEKLERVIAGFWQYSLIGKRMNQLGYWNPALGTTIGVIWPDVENKRPKMQMRSPYGFYPVIKDIDGYELSAAIFNTRYTRRQVKAMYPALPFDASSEVIEVTQYIGEKQIVTIVDDQYRVKQVENKWGFVPIVMIPNETFGEGPWGDSDIEWAIPLQSEYNYRMTLQNAILEMTIMQPLAIEDGDNLPEEIPMGPRDAIPVNPGGKVYRVPPVQVPYQYLQSQNDLLKMLDRVGQVPEVMRSEYSGNVMTGKGVSALLGPTQMAFNVKGNEIYPALAVLNKMALRMWDAMWPKETHTVYSVDNENHMSVETFTTDEFDGWYENVVTVDTSSYFDANSKFIMNLQAVQNRLMSRQTASAAVPGVDDAVLEAQLIAKELQADMDMQAANEARAQNNVQPDMGAQGATNANLSKGYMGETPPPTPTGGFEAPKGATSGETSPAENPPEQQGGLIEMFIEFFQDLPLKGKVWLAGNIVSDQSYNPQSPNWNGVEVFLESPNDKAAINATMRKDFPEVWGNLVYHSGAPNPQEPSILVFDPADQGEETPGDLFGAAENTPEGGMPPEMAAMMGGANVPTPA